MSSSFIHVVAYVSIPFIKLKSIPLYVYITFCLFIHLSMDTGCFCFLAIVNEAVVDTTYKELSETLLPVPLYVHSEVGLLNHMVIPFLIFLRTIICLFLKLIFCLFPKIFYAMGMKVCFKMFWNSRRGKAKNSKKKKNPTKQTNKKLTSGMLETSWRSISRTTSQSIFSAKSQSLDPWSHSSKVTDMALMTVYELKLWPQVGDLSLSRPPLWNTFSSRSSQE